MKKMIYMFVVSSGNIFLIIIIVNYLNNYNCSIKVITKFSRSFSRRDATFINMSHR